MKYKVGDIVFSTVWKKDVIIRGVRPNLIYEVADIEYLSRFMYTHELNLKSREDDIEKDMEEHQKIVDEIMDIQGIEPIEAEMEQIIHCPEGYIFKDENGNVINATKIVLEKKKKEYPKTYEECCKVMGIPIHGGIALVGNWCMEDGYIEQHLETLRALSKLLICRDAYWKIAGEEMGLGKPWELSIGTPIYYIYYNRTIGTIKNDYADDIQGNVILAFPTEEMRDAFKENFKKEIEYCKELL